jgi:hypothetical protein
LKKKYLTLTHFLFFLILVTLGVYDEDDLPELRHDGSDDEDGSIDLDTKLNSVRIEVVRTATTCSESKDHKTQQNDAHTTKVVQ